MFEHPGNFMTPVKPLFALFTQRSSWELQPLQHFRANETNIIKFSWFLFASLIFKLFFYLHFEVASDNFYLFTNIIEA